MVGRGVLLMLAVMVSSSLADPILSLVRHRRQLSGSTSGTSPPLGDMVPVRTLPFNSAVPCPIRCILSLSQAWAKTFAFDIPTTNMLGDRDILGSNDTVNLMCSLYASYTTCLKGCDTANGQNRAVVSAVPSYTQLCSDNISELDSVSPCLTEHTETFQRACQTENEDALASASRLVNQPKLKDNLLNEYCRATKVQLYCLFPAIRQTCGDQPYDLIRALANASFASIRLSIDDGSIQEFFPQCGSLFTILDHGLNVPSNSTTPCVNTTTPVQSSSSTSPTTVTSHPPSTSTQVIQKDEVDPYDGTAVPHQSTTPSSAPRTCLSHMALVTVTVALLFF